MLKEIVYMGNTFLVSDTGDIYKDGFELKKYPNRDGYNSVAIRREDGRQSYLRVSRAVALAFIPNDDPTVKREVNHKDYNRTNDCVDNLEWMSHTDNVRYSIPNRKDITGSNNPNYGNKKLSFWYKDHPEDALVKQSRRGLQNGRARKIRVLRDGDIVGEFDYIVQCCEFINSLFGTNNQIRSIRSKIDRSIRNKRSYKGLLFEKI